MRDATLRAEKDRWLKPVALYVGKRIHPNWVSVVAVVIGLLSAMAVVQEAYLLGLVLWWSNRIIDGLDGLIARLHEKQSDFGGYIDMLLDYVIYLAVPIAFMWANPSHPLMWAGVSLISSYVLNVLSWSVLSALLEKRQYQIYPRLTSIAMPTGLIEGAETILFYTLFFVFPHLNIYLFGLMSLLVLFTIGQRVVWAYHHLDQIRTDV